MRPMLPSLDALSSTDRGFLTWVAGMAREPLPEVWGRLLESTSTSGGTVIDGRHLVSLDLSVLGQALRWAVGEKRPLSMPLHGLEHLRTLDVSGMDLDTLDVRGLPALEELRCADNSRLKELELGENPRLRVLDASGAGLMVLDLRANAALEEVCCAGNGLAVLVLPTSGDALRELDCSRNQLMVLELGDRAALREVRAFRNALVRFEVGDLPRLAVLDLGRNELDAFTPRALPVLRSLTLARNKLAELDLRPLPALEELLAEGNYLERLDLSPCRALGKADLRANQLRELGLGNPALVELDVAENRLPSLDLGGAPRLGLLRAGGNELTELDLAPAPGLASVDVRDNALGALDPSPLAHLVELRCSGNPLRRLDVRANVELARLETRSSSAGPQVEATDLQRHLLRELRDAHRLGTRASEVEAMDTFELHDLALEIHGRDAEERLLRIVRAAACDRGTALMVYWTSSPHYYLRYARREEVADYELLGWDLLAAIEERVARDDFTSRVIRFDPRHDRQTRSVRGVDWTVDDRIVRLPPVRSIPEFMTSPS